MRLTVGGAADLVVELVPGRRADTQAVAGPQAAAGHTLRALPQDPSEAAAGTRRLEVVVDGWRFEVVVEDARGAALRERAVQASAALGVAVRLALRAQIPGRVTRLWTAAGDQVEAGQRLLAVEAMKMENEVRAPRAGTIESIAVSEGQRVELNDELLVLG